MMSARARNEKLYLVALLFNLWVATNKTFFVLFFYSLNNNAMLNVQRIESLHSQFIFQINVKLNNPIHLYFPCVSTYAWSIIPNILNKIYVTMFDCRFGINVCTICKYLIWVRLLWYHGIRTHDTGYQVSGGRFWDCRH